MNLSLKLSSIILVPLWLYYLLGELSARVSTAGTSFDDSFKVLLVISLVSIAISYVIQRFVYPVLKNNMDFEKNFQEKWLGGLLPYLLGIVVSFTFLYFYYKNCHFMSGCESVTTTVIVLFEDISKNGLHFRKPHVWSFSYLGLFLGSVYSLSIVISEVISRMIFAIKS